MDGPYRFAGMLDSDNNVEIIRIEKPEKGWYIFQLVASNLLYTPQAFALVVTGQLSKGLRQI